MDIKISESIVGNATALVTLSIPAPSSTGIDEVLKLFVATAMTLLSQYFMEWMKERKAKRRAEAASIKRKTHDDDEAV